MLLATLVVSGCAVFGCRPAEILVAETRRDERLESRIESQYTDLLGWLVEIRRDVVVPSYWVGATDGRWIAVDEPTWRRAEKGKPLEVCR
jgi:hypothetical protein